MTRLPAPVRALPRTLVLAPGESFASWLLRQAWRLGVAPRRLAYIVGLVNHPTRVSAYLPGAWALALPDSKLDTLVALTRATQQELERSLLAYYDGSAFDLVGAHPADARVAKHVAASEWVWYARTRCCPACLAHGNQVDGGTQTVGYWRLSWKLGFSFACRTHGLLLLDRCPACGERLGGGDGRATLVPAPGTRGLHPAACRARAPRARPSQAPGGRCGFRLDSQRAIAAALPACATLIDAQEGIDALLEAAAAAQTLERLRDLRLLVATLRIAQLAQPLVPVSAAIEEAWRAGEEARDMRTGRAAADRIWAAPPDTAAATGVLIASADNILSAADAHDRADRLAPHLDAARRRDEPLLRYLLDTARPSPRLAAAIQQRWQAPRLVRFARTPLAQRDRWAFRAQHVPARLGASYEQVGFAEHFPDASALRLRRYTALSLVTLREHCSLSDAARALDVPEAAARSAARASSKGLRRAGNVETFQRLLLELADVVDAGPLIDYGRRRRTLADFVSIPDGAWRVMTHGLIPGRGAPADWPLRRRAAAAWIWTDLTQSERSFAPGARALPRGSTERRALLIHVHDLDHQGGVTFMSRLYGYAARLAARIDAAEAPLSPDELAAVV